MPPRDNWSKATSNIEKIINSYSRMEQEKAKMMGAMLTDELKNRSNFMWKMAEKEQLDPVQRMLMQKYKQQQTPASPMGPQPDLGYGGRPPAGTERQGLGAMPELTESNVSSTELQLGPQGVREVKYPMAEMMLKAIQKKEAQGIPLSAGEKKRKEWAMGKVYGKQQTQYDPEATDIAYNNIVSHIESGNNNEVDADIEDLKKNFTVYQRSGVNAGEILNKLLKMRMTRTTTTPNWGDKIIGFLKSFLTGG